MKLPDFMNWIWLTCTSFGIVLQLEASRTFAVSRAVGIDASMRASESFLAFVKIYTRSEKTDSTHVNESTFANPSAFTSTLSTRQYHGLLSTETTCILLSLKIHVLRVYGIGKTYRWNSLERRFSNGGASFRCVLETHLRGNGGRLN